MVPQFETCGREIRPEVIHNFLPRLRRLHISFVFFVVWRFLDSLLGLFTVPLMRLTDPLSRRSFILLSVTLCCLLIIFLASSLEYVHKIFNNYLTLSNKNESSSFLTRSEKISVLSFIKHL